MPGRQFIALSDGLKVKAKYARAIETLLGAAVEAVLVDDSASARAIFDQIAAQKLGRACLKFPVPPTASGAAAPAELPETIQPAGAALNVAGDGGDNAAPHPVAGLLAGCYVADTAADFLAFWARESRNSIFTSPLP